MRKSRPRPRNDKGELPDRLMSSRHLVLRAFARWHAVNAPRFRIPLRFTGCSRGTLSFSFEGIQPAVTGYLNEWGFEVPVEWGDQCVDLIWWGSNVAPQRDEQGWYCGLFLPEWREHFRTREELYIALAFETFLEWVNGTLAKARWLCFYVDQAGSRFGAADVVRTRTQGHKLHGGCCVFLPVRITSG